MSERHFKVGHYIVSVDVYIPDDQGEWMTPIPRGPLVGVEGDHGFVLFMNGFIERVPLHNLRAVADDNQQPYPPLSPAEEQRLADAKRAEWSAAVGPIRKRRAPRKAAPQ